MPGRNLSYNTLVVMGEPFPFRPIITQSGGMTGMKKGVIFRGIALIILGILVLHLPTGCGSRKSKTVPDEGEKIVYSDTQYKMVQGAAIRKPAPDKGREYAFLPLTFRNVSSKGIIFSTRICVTAYALPSGEQLLHSHDAVMYGKEHIKGFTLFDGILFSGSETAGWLAFDLPEGTQSVHVDFSTGVNEGEELSFDCKI